MIKSRKQWIEKQKTMQDICRTKNGSLKKIKQIDSQTSQTDDE